MKTAKTMIAYIRAAGIKFLGAFSSLTLLMVLAQPATAHAAGTVDTGSGITTNYIWAIGLLSIGIAGVVTALAYSRR